MPKAWDDQVQSCNKRNEKPKFYKSLWKVFGGSYVLFSLGTLFDECIIRVAQPVFLRLLIRSFSDHSVTSSQQLVYAAGTLRLSKAAQEQTPIGQLINLLSNDVNRFDYNVLFLPYLFIGPLQTIIFSYFLWEELGISCLAGTGFTILENYPVVSASDLHQEQIKFLFLEEQKVSNNVEIRHGQGEFQKLADSRIVPSIHMENVTARWTNNTRNNDLSQVTAGLIGYKLIMVVGPIGSGKGQLLAQGTFQELMDRGIDFVNIITSESEESVSFRRASLTKLEEIEKEVKQDEETRASHVEKMAAGSVSWRTYWKYFRLGNSYTAMISVFCGFIFSQLLYSATDWWLAFWTNSEEVYSTSVRPSDHLAHNNTLLQAALNHSVHHPFAAASTQEDTGGSSTSARNIFAKLLDNELYLIFIVVLSNYYVIVPAILLILSLWLIRGFYIKTARDVKRLEAITKSPLFTHLTASVQGLTTIRASKRQNILIEQFDAMQDVHSAAWFLFISSNRWFGIWLEMISVLFLASVTFTQLSGSVGLAISSVLTLTGTFQWGMRQSAETENLMTSVERTIEYTKIKPEAKLESDPEHKPPPSWPSKGNIKFCNVSLSYDNNTSTIRKKFADCTILMIAHRLHSVVECDNVLVLENGQLKEYDHPHILYKNPFSLLSVMSRHTGKASYEQLKATAYKAYIKKFGPPLEIEIPKESTATPVDIEAILPVTNAINIIENASTNTSDISDTDFNKVFDKINMESLRDENTERNQSGDGEEGVGVVEMTSVQASTSDVVELAENLILEQSRLKTSPNAEDIIYDLSCVVCLEASGPPRRGCRWGHTICESCYQAWNLQVCPAEFNVGEEPEEDGEEEEDGKTTRFCNSPFYELNEAVRNAEHFRYFMKNSTFECGARALGCDAMLSGEEIEKHESEHCKFRFIRYCQFSSSQGCSQIFSCFRDNVWHLVQDHNIPVIFSTQGSFCLRYAQFLETSVKAHIGIVPLIRGAIVVPELGNKVCLLMMKVLEKVTRIWIGHCGHSIDDPPLVSTVELCPPKKSSSDKVVLEYKIPVRPAVSSMVDVEATKSYIEIENKVLDDGMVVKMDSEKHFTVLVTISIDETEPERDEKQVEPKEAELENVEDDDKPEEHLMNLKTDILEVVEENVADEEEYDNKEVETETVDEVEVDGSEVEDHALENEEEPIIVNEDLDDEEMYFPWLIEKPSDQPLTEVEEEYFKLLDQMKPTIIKRRMAVTNLKL
ncbi:hypothetical protein Ocin01_12506 [Orchesella cincta]|uniref:ABC transmembrane type-1 domain-containing protein n=1 Tax=Orchesella cincta TaxID=48709 RepID=A0A1D2MMI1_ORCCI|nr:hypothetical protein Ocin01_12506 [Orchesella cincta]